MILLLFEVYVTGKPGCELVTGYGVSVPNVGETVVVEGTDYTVFAVLHTIGQYEDEAQATIRVR